MNKPTRFFSFEEVFCNYFTLEFC